MVINKYAGNEKKTFGHFLSPLETKAHLFLSLILLSFYVTLILYVNCNSIHTHYFTPFLLQSTVSTTLWLFASRPFHCSALRQSLEVHPCPEKYRQGGDTRPVVVLFGWLLAKSRHLHKYGELYHQYGADVITVKLEVMEVRKIFVGELCHNGSMSVFQQLPTLPLP